MRKWYIVKENYSRKSGFPSRYLSGKYFGLGGDIWPIQSYEYASSIESKCIHIKVMDAYYIFVITDYDAAERYYRAAISLNMKPILLEISDDLSSDEYDGYDFGSPEGGYSVIETEILSRNDSEEHVECYLNRNTGLFRSVELAERFVDGLDKDKVECLDSYCVVGITVVSQVDDLSE